MSYYKEQQFLHMEFIFYSELPNLFCKQKKQVAPLIKISILISLKDKLEVTVLLQFWGINSFIE